ncbi:MAG: MBL fold metallo-hydrolase [Hyphomonadaceae bacterium]
MKRFLPIAAALLLGAAQAPPPPAAAPPIQIAEGVTLLPGAFAPGRGPDGNTIVFDAPEGLIVVDTGRHTQHSDGILAFAQARARPIAAIFNTHWHLDHSSGNVRLKAAYPNARVYTSNAIDRALTGFIARNLEAARASLAQDMPDVQRDETNIFIETMQTPDSLRPDAPIERSGVMAVAGRTLDVRVAANAVTEADVWLYDPQTRVAVVGDLVTFPAPFFETACPNEWRMALSAVSATPFETVIPGHGAPMNREQFETYRRAYGAFIDCVSSSIAADACGADWARRIDIFLADDQERRGAARFAEYYVGFLRQNGGRSPDCQATR